jgi:putative ABC transport system permease protein
MELIPIENLSYMILPLIVIWYFYYKWIGNSTEIVYATIRMVTQLLAIGYVLIYLFNNNSWYVGFLVLFMMILMSSFIVLRNIEKKNKRIFFIIFTTIAVGGGINLYLVIKFVLELTPFYEPRYVIPLAGMLYSNCMNAVSIVAERFEQEIKKSNYEEAKKISFKASMIPKVNTLLAVGLVSLPGMMTGQILSGVDPLVAVRYQIVVMAMIMGSAGISVILYLRFMKKEYYNTQKTKTTISKI